MTVTRTHAMAGDGTVSGGVPEPGRGLRLLVRRPGVVLLACLALLVAGALVGRSAPDKLIAGAYLDPSAESQRVAAALDNFAAAPPDLVLLAQAPAGGVDAPEAAAAGRSLTSWLSVQPGVGTALSYWDTGNTALRASSGEAAVVSVTLTGGEDAAQRTVARLLPELDARSGVLKVAVTGAAAVGLEVDEQAEADLLAAEKLTFPLTLLVLVLVFGSAVAAGLPLLVGAAAVVGTLVVLVGVASVTPTSTYALNLTSALGFGLAVDYSLFLVTRFREERAGGREVPEAVVISARTAGRTVAFSALTVALSLSALLLFPIPFLRSLGAAGIAVTVLAAVAALVLVPACLALLGGHLHRGDLLGPLRRRRARSRSQSSGAWHALAAVVMRRPVLVAASVTAALLVVLLPFTDVRFGVLDHRTLPADNPVRTAAERLERDFPALNADSIDIVLPAGGAASATGSDDALDDYAVRISQMRGVDRVDTATGTYLDGRRAASEPDTAAQYVSETGTWLRITPTVGQEPRTTQDLVRTLRETPAPAQALVGGDAASVVDAAEAIAQRLPWALLLICTATLVLVFLFTGSVLIPVKAVITNALSLTATFGALVYVFQQGHLRWLVGDFTPTGTLEITLPVLVFCIAFGLSMDYELFLLSRIDEAHRAGADTATAVSAGLQRTGGLITAAAAILVTVFLALASSDLTALKIVGVGLTIAVLLDATVVRTLLVPAVMRLAGEANWWAPRPLRRLHQRLGVTD